MLLCVLYVLKFSTSCLCSSTDAHAKIALVLSEVPNSEVSKRAMAGRALVVEYIERKQRRQEQKPH